ncbi:hypothetical protein HDU82_005603 [Entophlyctis luteolus]|nr:hypothetical protein HDU82_005603 [Entophlyctis luteolus]
MSRNVHTHAQSFDSLNTDTAASNPRLDARVTSASSSSIVRVPSAIDLRTDRLPAAKLQIQHQQELHDAPTQATTALNKQRPVIQYMEKPAPLLKRASSALMASSGVDAPTKHSHAHSASDSGAKANKSLLDEGGTPATPEAITEIFAVHSEDKSHQMPLKDATSSITEHRLPFDSLLTQFGSQAVPARPLDSAGLSHTDARDLQLKYGPNLLPEPSKESAYYRFLMCLTSLFNLLLLLGGAAYLMLWFIDPLENFSNIYIGSVLLCVAVINAFIEYYELTRVSHIVESFKNMIPHESQCIRASLLQPVKVSDIVPGDVIFLKPGDKIPADAILFNAYEFRVDNSSLTGESETVERSPVLGGILSDTNVLDAKNVVFGGTTVSNEFNTSFQFAIGILIAWIPQGLPVTVTMLLAVAGERMAKRDVLIKDLHGVETLGAMTLLATDKTGTLTLNEMTVSRVWTNLASMYAGDPSSAPQGERLLKLEVSGVAQILHMAATCTRARFDGSDGKHTGHVVGDATDKGLLEFAASRLANVEKSGLTFVGLVSLADPPKAGVADAIMKIRQAGIKVIMVTGDHPLTAAAIAERVNILSHPTREKLAKSTGVKLESVPEDDVHATVVNGENLHNFTEEDWDRVLSKKEVVFARTSPKQKLEIVKRAQSIGHIVGVTGDGINDAAALRHADLGIAMNKTGSDVSKEAAGMILLDDNFTSTVVGILEVVPYLLNVIIPIPLALTAIQILVVDLGFELFITLSFAWEPPEDANALLCMGPRKPVTPESIQLMINRRNAKREVLEAQSEAIHDADTRRGLGSKNADPEKQEFDSPSSVQSHLVSRYMSEDEQFLIQDSNDDINENNEAKRAAKKLRKRWFRHIQEIKAMMTDIRYWKAQQNQWRAILAVKGGEKLVDAEVLSWAYLEAGIMEAGICIGTFFAVLYWSWGITPTDAKHIQILRGFKPHSADFLLRNGGIISGSDQVEALQEAQSAFYLSILIVQLWTLFACKTRLRLPTQKLFVANVNTLIAIAVGSAFAFFIVYVPFMSGLFLTSGDLNPLFLLIPLSSGSIVFFYSIVRRHLLQKCKVPVTNLMDRVSSLAEGRDTCTCTNEINASRLQRSKGKSASSTKALAKAEPNSHAAREMKDFSFLMSNPSINALIISYGSTLGAMALYYSDNCPLTICGQPLNPSIDWKYELVTTALAVCLSANFLLVNDFIKMNAATLLDRDAFIASIHSANVEMRRQLRKQQQEEVIDLEAPLAKVVKTLRDVRDASNDAVFREEVDQIIAVLNSGQLYTPDIYQNAGDADVSEWVRSMMAQTENTGIVLGVTAGEPRARGQSIEPKAAAALLQWHFTGGNLSAFAGLPDARVLQDALHNYDDPMFDVCALNDGAASGHVLFHTALYVFTRHGLLELHKIRPTTFQLWLIHVERGYRSSNPYHNAIHAADVLHSLHYYLTRPRVSENISPEDFLAAFIAAIIHDYMHPGVNNAFLVNSMDPLAIRYNDIGVLENFHCAQAFEDMHANGDINILANLTPEAHRSVREAVCAAVLATDIASHFEWIGRFRSRVPAGLDLASKADKRLVMNMAIKCADVNNPTKELHCYKVWTDRVMEEFFLQGEEELRMGLPISMFMDRATTSVPKCQIGFIDFIVFPLFEVWASFMESDVALHLENIQSNRRYWKEQLL